MNNILKILSIVALGSLLGFVPSTQAEDYIVSNNMGEDRNVSLIRNCGGKNILSSLLVKGGEQNHKFSTTEGGANCCLGGIALNDPGWTPPTITSAIKVEMLALAPSEAWECDGGCGNTNITIREDGTITAEVTCFSQGYIGDRIE